MSMAAVLITGAGGFVGAALARGLADLGRTVVAVDRTFDAAARARLSGVTLIEADLTAQADLPAAEIVIHAAAITTGPQTLGWTAAAHVAANMAPLLHLLDHAGRTGPRAFVFLSSSGVFAPGDGPEGLCDDTPPTATGPYSAAKRAGEVLVPSALPSGCAPHVLRLGYLYGPCETARPTRQRVSLLQGWIDRAQAGEPIEATLPGPRRDWTWVPDLAPALARLLDGPGDAQPRHLCAPAAPSDTEVIDLIRRHRPVTLREVPATPVKAPMIPSNFPALAGFAWTGIDQGIARLMAEAA